MTRYTNIGIKRTFFQAGFDDGGGAALSDSPPEASNSASSGVPEEKHKRNKKSIPSPSADGEGDVVRRAYEGRGKAKGEKSDMPDFSSKRVNVNATGYVKRKEGAKGAKDKSASEQRRLNRIEERQANTICFACRKKGHAAKDCPTAKERLEGQGDALDGEDGKGRKTAAPLTGICYRCGSSRHSLSRCRTTENPSNPLPFASCFVCSGKGHIASKCPQNKSKGVYPNGGSCRLCGETSHLARDCGLRKQENLQGTVILGTGDAAGADEDDFHLLKRTNAQMDQEERAAMKLSKKLAKAAAEAGQSVKMPSAKKVVVF